MRLLWVLSVVSVIALRRESLCFLSRTKRIVVELYTRMSRCAHESSSVSGRHRRPM